MVNFHIRTISYKLPASGEMTVDTLYTTNLCECLFKYYTLFPQQSKILVRIQARRIMYTVTESTFQNPFSVYPANINPLTFLNIFDLQAKILVRT